MALKLNSIMDNLGFYFFNAVPRYYDSIYDTSRNFTLCTWTPFQRETDACTYNKD